MNTTIRESGVTNSNNKARRFVVGSLAAGVVLSLLLGCGTNPAESSSSQIQDGVIDQHSPQTIATVNEIQELTINRRKDEVSVVQVGDTTAKVTSYESGPKNGRTVHMDIYREVDGAAPTGTQSNIGRISLYVNCSDGKTKEVDCEPSRSIMVADLASPLIPEDFTTSGHPESGWAIINGGVYMPGDENQQAAVKSLARSALSLQ